MIRFSALLCVMMASLSTDCFGQVLKSGKVPDWGNFENPKKDCRIEPLEKSLKMTLPAVAHDLSIEINRMNAPRVLQSVNGDFMIQVKVANVSHPENQSVIPGRKPFCSAGLLVWQNKFNYIRLERASLNNGGSIATYANWELRHDGRFARPGQANDLPLGGTETWLRITRAGNTCTGAASPDGAEWSPLPGLMLEGPDLQAGIVAINDTPTPFTPVFSEFSLQPATAKQ